MQCPQCERTCDLEEKRCTQCQRDLTDLFVCRDPSCRQTQTVASFCIACGERLTGPLSDQSVTTGDLRYRIREWIGGGGMGEVYRALEEDNQGSIRREVAIKLNKDTTSPDLSDRFQREVQILTQLKNPHNVRVYGYGEHKERGILIAQFMIMELLQGVTLQRRLEDGCLDPSDALTLFRQIAGALQEAHQKGVIHRDLKPNNIMLLDPPSPLQTKLFDFGLSKVTRKESLQLSSSGVILGTLWYMSPEQARGESLDHRTDLFSLGVILYQTLTGQLPFPANNLFELYQLHPHGPPPTLSILPQPLQEILLRCLAYRPKDRFSDLHEALAWIDTIDLSSLPSKIQPPPISSPTQKLALAPLNPGDPFQHTDLPSIPSPFPFSRTFLGGLALVITASALLSSLFFFRSRSFSSPQTSLASQQLPRPLAPVVEIDLSASLPPSGRSSLPSAPLHPATERKIGAPFSPLPRPTKAPSEKPKRHKTTKVVFSIDPPCEKGHLETLPSGPSRPFAAEVLLKPGLYKVHCSSPKQRFSRSFRFRILGKKTTESVERSWKTHKKKIFLRPWAYLYIDGVFIPECQTACEIPLWEGKTSFHLRRCNDKVTQAQCLQRPTHLDLVHQETSSIHATSPSSLLFRWNPKP